MASLAIAAINCLFYIINQQRAGILLISRGVAGGEGILVRLQADGYKDMFQAVQRCGSQKFVREIEREGGVARLELLDECGAIERGHQTKQIFQFLRMQHIQLDPGTQII